MPPAPAFVYVPLVSPQVSWSSCNSGVGVATTLAHIPRDVTTPQSVALSAPLPMVPSSSSELLFPSLAPLLSRQAPLSGPAHVRFAPGFDSVCSIGPHSSSACPENPEWGVC